MQNTVGMFTASFFASQCEVSTLLGFVGASYLASTWCVLAFSRTDADHKTLLIAVVSLTDPGLLNVVCVDTDLLLVKKELCY